jgi:hypothetical protein
MANKIPTCPVCGGEMTITHLHCPVDDVEVSGHFNTGSNPFSALTPEQLQFVVTFVRCEGRYNRMEEEMKLSYPTLRSRFNEILGALGFEPGKEDIVKPGIDERRKILEDLDTGKISAEEAQLRLAGKKEPNAGTPA